MSVPEILLSRLDRVKETGRGRWIACCPAHDDKKPSLAVRELDDGTLLVKCFSGCGAGDIVAAVGLELKDLFPPTDKTYRPRERRPWNPLDVLRCIVTEARVVTLAAADIAEGVVLNDADRERLELAAERLSAALSLAEGN